MNARRVYLLLFLAGVVIPYLEFGPWVAEHGLNLRLMIEQLFANRIGAFFGADVALSAVAVFVFAGVERRRIGGLWWLPVVAVLLAGVSAGLPLLLYLRVGRDTALIAQAGRSQ